MLIISDTAPGTAAKLTRLRFQLVRKTHLLKWSLATMLSHVECAIVMYLGGSVIYLELAAAFFSSPASLLNV